MRRARRGASAEGWIRALAAVGGLGTFGALAGALAGAAAAQGAGPIGSTDPPPAVVERLDRLTGTAWLGRGDGFTSVLVYEWAVPGRVLTSENTLFDDDGNPFRHYRGAYVWDPARGGLALWVEGPGSERHVGEATSEADGLWHRARTGSGGYRSVVTQVSDTLMEYRAAYTGVDATDAAVRAGEPLVYRRPGAAAARAREREERAFMARSGGRWWAANPEAAGDPDAPPGFLYQAREAGDALHVEILVERPEGGTHTAWRVVSAWDAGAGVIRMHQVGGGGALLRGRLDPLADGTALIRMDGAGADGEPIIFMDRNAPAGPDRFGTRSWLLREGVWEESMRSTWQRATPP